MAIDEAKLNGLLHRFVLDLGATVQAANVVIGDKLGLYKELAQLGPASAAELAARIGAPERFVAEWLAGQAAGGYVAYEPASGRYRLDAEQALALADEGSPVFLPGAFQLACAAVRDEPAVTAAVRAGIGMAWQHHNDDVFQGCERFLRPAYAANLVQQWIPALDGVEERLLAGARVADVGCGHGASSILIAQAYPASSVVGFDHHGASVEWARKAASDAGVADRARFEVAAAADFPGSGYDLVAMFDCLHDMGDPVGAAEHVRASLAPGGTWLVVEPAAGDSVEDNLNPVGRAYYGLSTLLCLPNSLSQQVGLALGAQAGEARLREVATQAGFGSFRRAAQTPFNHVYEARP
jgi:SAM-dependent methyltransferase